MTRPRFSMIFLAACTLAATAHAKFSPELAAVLTEVQGPAELRALGAADWRPAEKGMKLPQGTSLRTGPGARMELVFEDGTSLRLEENSSLTVEKASKAGKFREFLMTLWKGRVLSSVGKTSKYGRPRYRVKTPVCAASVRGTAFAVEHSSDVSRVAVFDGEVEAAGGKEKTPLALAANMETDAAADRPLAAPRPLTAEMEAYRTEVVAHFLERAERYRAHMEEVQQMHREYMEKRGDDYRRIMEERQEQYRKKMEGR